MSISFFDLSSPSFFFHGQEDLRKGMATEGRVVKLAALGRRFPVMHYHSYCALDSAFEAEPRGTFRLNL